jgi:hypothetical protein
MDMSGLVDENGLRKLIGGNKRIVVLPDMSISLNSSDLGVIGFAFVNDKVIVWMRQGDKFRYSERSPEYDFYLHPAVIGLGKKLKDWVMSDGNKS